MGQLLAGRIGSAAAGSRSTWKPPRPLRCAPSPSSAPCRRRQPPPAPSSWPIRPWRRWPSTGSRARPSGSPTIRNQTLDAEPFLVVGLVAGIRKVLIVTAEAEKSFRWNVEGVELLVLAGLILVMATAGYVWRRSTRPGDYFPLQEARRAPPSPEPSPTPVGGS
ncbi:phosphate-starvation-inducible PsiE family protein [Streptomyces sp. NPDC056399]|uniref:phosphate-starvation-inducible PsiE family protein n=1 Tax=unclassified Streptomyces TaxID=2593676 RepID=UPI0035DC19E3